MKKIWNFIVASFVLILAGVFLATGLVVYFSFDLPRIDTLADYNPPVPSQILARDGTILAQIGIENREIVDFDEIPQIIVDAFLSAEDDSFYQHEGVDYVGIFRAMLVNLKSGRVVQGGSTITQQVAKSLLLTRERSYMRKIKDILLAQRIEKKFSKREILYLYLNQFYLGGGFYGVKAAFSGYFGKELSEATIAETAMMAGLPVAPGRYSPYINPQFAKRRQYYVLRRMLETGKISKEQYDDAIKEKIKFRIRKKKYFKAAYFTDWVRQRVIELVDEEKFLSKGFRVMTTLDWDMQQVAEKEIRNGLRSIDRRQGYKGPLRYIGTKDEQENEEIQFRKRIFQENSNFFTLSDDNKRIYELEFSEEEFEDVLKSRKEWQSKINDYRFIRGMNKNDSLVSELKINKNYEAIVTKIDDRARLIYVTLGGVPGIIPYENFNWAHKRIISEKRQNYWPITKPSSIVKSGDVVWVELKKRSVPISPYINKSARKVYDKLKYFKEVREQRYLLCFLDQEPDVQGSLISINPHNGEIIAFVGGSNFRKSQFNRVVQSKRQPGSSFKPILYAAALENGLTPSSIIIDSPEALGGVDQSINWKPKNYDGKFWGPMTFREALEKSRNVPTIKIASKLGVSRILDFVDRISFNVTLEPDLSLALGSFGVDLMEIVSTYSIFPNGGKIVDPKSIISITDKDNNLYVLDENIKKKRILEKQESKDSVDISEMNTSILKQIMLTETASVENIDDIKEETEVNPYHAALGGEQVYDPRLAFIMANLLKGVVLHGTGMSTKSISHFIGGKTGTTNNYVDAWFIGFSSNIATGVWTGFDDNKTLGWGETGAKSALPIWREFMRSGLKKYGENDFTAPQDIVNVRVDKKTGQLADASNPNAFMEAFVIGTEPGINRMETSASGEKGQLLDKKYFFEDEYFNQQ
ncbi:MAG: PBP1A family penicillin-binding protein [Bacteriovoracaceae bacterium]|nr:PBP1A family penicillin-binding protein [Bacteriovoracaceae bacterium]